MRAIAIVAAAICAECASAAPVTVEFSGAVTTLRYSECQTSSASGSCTSWSHTNLTEWSLQPGITVRIGDSFSGHITYETNASGGLSSDGFQMSYGRAILESTFETPGFSLTKAGMVPAFMRTVGVTDGRYGWDSMLLWDTFNAGEFFGSLQLSAIDRTGTVFDSTALPSTVDGSSFHYTSLDMGLLRRSDGDQVHFGGALTYFQSANAVPEPSTAALALLGVAVALRRRRAQPQWPSEAHAA